MRSMWRKSEYFYKEGISCRCENVVKRIFIVRLNKRWTDSTVHRMLLWSPPGTLHLAGLCQFTQKNHRSVITCVWESVDRSGSNIVRPSPIIPSQKSWLSVVGCIPSQLCFHDDNPGLKVVVCGPACYHLFVECWCLKSCCCCCMALKEDNTLSFQRQLIYDTVAVVRHWKRTRLYYPNDN